MPATGGAIRTPSKATATAIAVGLLGCAAHAFASSPGAEVGGGAEAAIRANGRARVIIAFRRDPISPMSVLSLPSAESPARRRALARLSPGDFEPLFRWRSVSAAAGLLNARGLERLRADPDVLRVDLDEPGGANLSESVPLIGADSVHAQGVTGLGVTVALLDTGVLANHADLADDVIAQHCFCVNADGTGCCPSGQREQSGVGSAEDDNGHGTNVAGILASAGRIAPVGVAPDVRIVAVKVLDRNSVFSGTAQVVSGLDWLANERPDVRIVNVSLGTSALYSVPCDHASAPAMALAEAIDLLRARGVSVFVSTGNDRSINRMEAPACVGSAISVGAVYDADFGAFPLSVFGCAEATAPDRIACFSNSAPGLHLLAPGAAITSTGINGGRSTYFGTSQASPHAAATAALLLEARPTLDPAAIDGLLSQTGRLLTDPRNGLTTPRVDAAAALRAVGVGAPSACVADAATLCLNGGRFRVQAAWEAPAILQRGVGNAAALTADTGYFWFFSPNNVELAVKVVDGRAVNGRWWFFSGALSNVQYTLTVTDTATGAIRVYFNPDGALASLADASAFGP